MKRWLWIVVGGWCVAAAKLWAQGVLPGGPATATVPVVLQMTVALDAETNCAVVATGTGGLTLGRFTGPISNRVAQTELVRMELAGRLEDGTLVTVRAGSNLVGRATLGTLSSTNRFFPASSELNLTLEIGLPGGTNLVNLTPIPLTNSVSSWPPVGQPYVSTLPVPLVLAADTNVVVGSLVQLTLTVGNRGNNQLLAMSASVTGTNAVRLAVPSVCLASTGTAVVAGQRQLFSGVWQSVPGCDESFQTNLQFTALWNTTQRPGDWRGFHTGRFVLFHLTSTGRTNIVGFGTMDGSNGAGTRRAPLELDAEDCNSCYRFEGRLRGRVIERGPLAGARIEGTYAGEYLDASNNPVSCCPPPPTLPDGAFRMTIEGVTLVPCR